MRVLLAFKERYTTHMDSVRTAVRRCSAEAEIRVVEPGALEEQTERFDPQLVVCDGALPERADGQVPARIELSIDPAQPSRFRVGQRRWESLNPGLEELTAVVAEAERLLDGSSPG